MRDQIDQNVQQSRRSALFRLAEGASVVPLAAIAVNSSMQQDTRHVLDLSNAQISRERGTLVVPEIDALLEQAKQRAVHASELNDQYRRAYHKSRAVPTIHVGSDGHTTTSLRTEYYWDVPSGLPSERVVDDFAHSSARLSNGLHALTGKPLVDLHKTAEISIRAERGDSVAGKIMVGLIYAGEIGVLLSYEEALAAFRAWNCHGSYREELEGRDTPHQHTRRGFIKLGAAIVGMGGALLANSAVARRTAESEERLNGALKGVSILGDTDHERFIGEEIGVSLDEMERNSEAGMKMATEALRRTIREGGVREALESYKVSENRFLETVRQLASGEGRRALGYLCLSRRVTTDLERANSAEARVAALRGAFEALSVGAAMGAFLIGGEMVNRRLKGEPDPYGPRTGRY